MENQANFDALARKATQTNALEDLNALFGAAFELKEWIFIMRGDLTNAYPYIASNAGYADSQPMVRAFTDSERAQRFARENNLAEADGTSLTLNIPTEKIIEYLEGFVQYGAYGVWFNSDTGSDGFFIPIKQLRPIKEHLEKLKQPQQTAAEKAATTTALLIIKDGLGFPSGFVSEASYLMNIYCRLPEFWTDGDKIKSEYREKIYEFLYGTNWREGNDDGSHYVVLEGYSQIVDEHTAENTKWAEKQNTDDIHYRFYIIGADGNISSVKAEEFQANIDAEMKSGATAEARARQDKMAGFGMTQTADGGFDINLSINERGSVGFETNLAPFYRAIMPLLTDFQGTGDFVTLLAFEPGAMSEFGEFVLNNPHGPYFKSRGFVYLNPKNGVRIGVTNFHSNHLRHVRTNSELIVSMELCKNLDNQTAALFYAFRGPRADVLNLAAAIQPLLEANNYQAAQ